MGIVVSLREVKERRRAAEARVWQAAIVNSFEGPIISKTLDGVIESWNPGATRLVGYEPEEIIGQPVTMIIPSELQSHELEIRARISREERVDRFETVRVAKDGRRLDLWVTMSPVRNDKEEIVGVSMIGSLPPRHGFAPGSWLSQGDWPASIVSRSSASACSAFSPSTSMRKSVRCTSPSPIAPSGAWPPMPRHPARTCSFRPRKITQS